MARKKRHVQFDYGQLEICLDILTSKQDHEYGAMFDRDLLKASLAIATLMTDIKMFEEQRAKVCRM